MILFRWLGNAGIELTYNNQVLLIDPYLTRIPFWRQWIGPVQPDRALVHKELPCANFILVTHAHFDHLLDVPAVLEDSTAQALGTYNTIALLQILGIPPKQVRQIEAGDDLVLGEFHVEVYSSHHGWAPGFAPRPLLPRLHPPLHARDYRMDNCLSFLITIDDLRLLVTSGESQESAPPADVLFANPVFITPRENTFFEQVHPRLVIPIHWDDFWRPLDRPVRPMFRPPSWKNFPPLQRVNLQRLEEDITHILPGTKILIAERLRSYNLMDRL